MFVVIVGLDLEVILCVIVYLVISFVDVCYGVMEVYDW